MAVKFCKRLFMAMILGAFLPYAALAEEVERADPLFPGMPGYDLLSSEQSYSMRDIFLSADRKNTVEGRTIRAEYVLKKDQAMPKAEEIFRHYAKFFADISGQTLFNGGYADYRVFSFRAPKGDHTLFGQGYVHADGKSYVIITVEAKGSEAESDGAPMFVLEEKSAGATLYLTFDPWQATLRSDTDFILEHIAAYLESHPEQKKVVVEGYTDNVGSEEANLKLSRQRAESVAAELVKRGVAASRLRAVGKGLADPVAANDTEEGRAANRRVVLKLE